MGSDIFRLMSWKSDKQYQIYERVKFFALCS